MGYYNKSTINDILALAGNDLNILKEVLVSFVKDCEEILESMEEAVSSEKEHLLEQNIHNLKGVCDTIGATELANSCRDIENRGFGVNNSSYIELLKSQFLELRKELKKEYNF